jgi:ABC-type multidrug transport system permease subunit
MHFLAVSLRKDWARTRRDPFQFLVSLGIPLVLAVLMSLVFGRGPGTPRGRLLVADEDNTMASTRFLEAFHREPLSKMIAIEKVSRDSGRARIDRGDASAFLLIPKGTQLAFALNLPIQLQLFTNPSERILPQMIQETLAITVDAAFYLRRANFSPPPNPPLIELETAAVQERKPTRSFAAVFLPSMLFMGLLFIASAAAADIWKERMLGTLRRIASSPVSMASYLAGRVVFVSMLYAAVALAGLVAANRMVGMPVPNLPEAALWITFTGTVFYLLFLWISVQPATQRAASVLTNLIIFPLAMLGGCFFPFEWMPAWMAAIGRLTPNGWALSQFKAILDGSIDAGHLATAAALMAALGALAFLLTLRRLRGGFAV